VFPPFSLSTKGSNLSKAENDFSAPQLRSTAEVLAVSDQQKGAVLVVNHCIRELEQQLENALSGLREQKQLVKQTQSLLVEKEVQLRQACAELAVLKSEHAELRSLAKRKRETAAEHVKQAMETLLSMDDRVEDEAALGLSVRNSRKNEDEQGREPTA
jgi:hypothetical protein